MSNAEVWIETYTGRHFSLLQPRVEDVDIIDIAHALSQLCRFTGHTKDHYSVAQHSVLVAQQFRDPLRQLMGLLHDASEAYVGDMNRPLKEVLLEYKRIEYGIEDAILRRFGIKFDEQRDAWHDVKDADRRLCLVEARAMMPNVGKWAVEEPFYIACLTPAESEWIFLHTFEDLTK